MSLVFPRYRVGPLYHLRVVWSPSRVKRPTSVGFFTSVARLSGLSGLVMPELVFPLCSLLCEKMCPPWWLGKDYTQQWKYMNVAPDAYLLVAVEAAAIHHNQKERAAPNYTPGLGFPKYRRWPLWFLTPALFDCGAPLTGSRRLFKPHGAFYARDTERNRVHCRDRGLVWCYAPIALYFHHCNESNSVAVFPACHRTVGDPRQFSLNMSTRQVFAEAC